VRTYVRHQHGPYIAISAVNSQMRPSKLLQTQVNYYRHK